jgi:hypothetical protein
MSGQGDTNGATKKPYMLTSSGTLSGERLRAAAAGVSAAGAACRPAPAPHK